MNQRLYSLFTLYGDNVYKNGTDAINVDASHVTPLRGNICCFEECIFFSKE